MDIQTERKRLKIVAGAIIIAIFSTLWFLVLPLNFYGSGYNACDKVTGSCQLVTTAQWHWFGMYHMISSPEGGLVANMIKYNPTSTAEQWVALAIAAILGAVTYIALYKTVRFLWRRHP